MKGKRDKQITHILIFGLVFTICFICTNLLPSGSHHVSSLGSGHAPAQQTCFSNKDTLFCIGYYHSIGNDQVQASDEEVMGRQISQQWIDKITGNAQLATKLYNSIYVYDLATQPSGVQVQTQQGEEGRLQVASMLKDRYKLYRWQNKKMGRASRKEDLNTSIKANAEMSQPNEQANSQHIGNEAEQLTEINQSEPNRDISEYLDDTVLEQNKQWIDQHDNHHIQFDSSALKQQIRQQSEQETKPTLQPIQQQSLPFIQTREALNQIPDTNHTQQNEKLPQSQIAQAQKIGEYQQLVHSGHQEVMVDHSQQVDETGETAQSGEEQVIEQKLEEQAHQNNAQQIAYSEKAQGVEEDGSKEEVKQVEQPKEPQILHEVAEIEQPYQQPSIQQPIQKIYQKVINPSVQEVVQQDMSHQETTIELPKLVEQVHNIQSIKYSDNLDEIIEVVKLDNLIQLQISNEQPKQQPDQEVEQEQPDQAVEQEQPDQGINILNFDEELQTEAIDKKIEIKQLEQHANEVVDTEISSKIVDIIELNDTVEIQQSKEVQKEQQVRQEQLKNVEQPMEILQTKQPEIAGLISQQKKRLITQEVVSTEHPFEEAQKQQFQFENFGAIKQLNQQIDQLQPQQKAPGVVQLIQGQQPQVAKQHNEVFQSGQFHSQSHVEQVKEIAKMEQLGEEHVKLQHNQLDHREQQIQQPQEQDGTDAQLNNKQEANANAKVTEQNNQWPQGPDVAQYEQVQQQQIDEMLNINEKIVVELPTQIKVEAELIKQQLKQQGQQMVNQIELTQDSVRQQQMLHTGSQGSKEQRRITIPETGDLIAENIVADQIKKAFEDENLQIGTNGNQDISGRTREEL